MKKTLLIVFAGLISTFSLAQTATDFTATDCNSTSHNLFTELNAGKVVVICWVMPCSACIGPASTAGTTVFNMSNPNVVFYVVDDAGNSTCSTLNTWVTNNSITTNAVFSNAGNPINMTDYGTAGMPKTVVLGGANHQVFYNQNGTISQTALQAAINSALTTGIQEVKNDLSTLKLFPSPVVNAATISYSLGSSTDVKVEIVNALGQNVQSVFEGKQTAGDFNFNLDCAKLNNGVYFVKLTGGKESKTVSFTVAH